MVEKLKELFLGKDRREDDSDLRKKYESLKERYERVLDEYESLSRKYFAVKTSRAGQTKSTGDESAPKCVRKAQETCSYFRMRNPECVDGLSEFLRRSGHWTLEQDPDIRVGHQPESCERVVWFLNEKMRRVEIPFGSVLLVFDESPRTEWLVIPEDVFVREWLLAS